jgi:hypothetical protein
MWIVAAAGCDGGPSIRFYKAIGYAHDRAVSFGKRLKNDT